MNWSIETYLLVGFVLSVVFTVGGVLVLGVVLVKLPPRYFVAPTVRRLLPNTHPIIRSTVIFLRNLLGAALVLLGLIMAVPGMPGPGILTIAIGVTVMDFAEKRRWTRWVISRPPVLKAANALRRKYGRPPFVMPPANR